MRRAPSLPLPAENKVPRTRRGDWATIGTLLPYLWAYKGRVIAAIACLIAAKVANVVNWRSVKTWSNRSIP